MYFSDYLLFIIFGAVAIPSGKRRWVPILVVPVATAALFASGTRAGLLGLCVGILVVAVWDRSVVTKKRLFAVGGLLVMCAGFYFSPAGVRLRDRVAQWSDDAKGGPRLLLWRDTMSMARDHLLVGVGPETFASVFPKYQSPALARAYPDFYHESPHNVLLDALLSQGLLGPLVLFSLIAFAVRASCHWEKDRRAGRILCAGLIASLVCHQFMVFVAANLFLFYISLAILVAGSFSSSATNPPPDRRISGFRPVITPLCTLFAVMGLQLAHVDLRWGVVKRSLAAGRLEAALGQYEWIRRLYPPESGPDLWYSRELAAAVTKSMSEGLTQQVQDQSMEAAERATRISEDRQNALYNLAVFYASRGDLVNSEKLLALTVKTAPNWFKPHWLSAELALLTGKTDVAVRESRLAVGLSGAQSSEVVDTLNRASLADKVGDSGHIP